MSNPVLRSYDVSTVVVGPQVPINLEWLSMAQTTIGVYITSGTAAYSVEMTLEDVNDPNVVPKWFTHKDFPVGTAVTNYSQLQHPFTWIRINIAAITGTVEFKVQCATLNGFRGS